MMSKYKIRPYREGFKVWELRDMGNGYSWDDPEKRVFRSREEAEKYIKEKRGEKNDSSTKSGRDQTEE